MNSEDLSIVDGSLFFSTGLKNGKVDQRNLKMNIVSEKSDYLDDGLCCTLYLLKHTYGTLIYTVIFSYGMSNIDALNGY